MTSRITARSDADSPPPASVGFRASGERLSNWGRWGPDDQLGTLNLITPDRRAAAAGLIRTGKTIPLGLAFDDAGPQPQESLRQNTLHLMTRLSNEPTAPGGFGYLDDAVFLHTQCATQIDGLAHVFYDGALYNGHLVDETVGQGGAKELGIEGFRSGVQGRGILLDVARFLGVDRMQGGQAIGRDLLERTSAAQRVDVRAGDTVLIRTGWMTVFTIDRDRDRYLREAPGIDVEAATWLCERDVAFTASDNWGVEVSPGADPSEVMPVHCILVRDAGMPLGEMFDLEGLGSHVSREGVSEFWFSCHPLPITGGVGSPIAPTATF